ncbi:hypothetical protein Tco_0607159 [Tanacetum coccineum]
MMQNLMNAPPGFRPTKYVPSSTAKPLYGSEFSRTRSDSSNLSLNRPEPFHVTYKVPFGDTPYVSAKNVQLVDKDPERAIALFWAAINAGDRVDSALKDMAIVMKQQNRAEEAIEAIKSLRHRCSDQAQESLDNILLDLYKPVATGSIGTCPYHLARILWASSAQHGPGLPTLRFSKVLVQGYVSCLGRRLASFGGTFGSRSKVGLVAIRRYFEIPIGGMASVNREEPHGDRELLFLSRVADHYTRLLQRYCYPTCSPEEIVVLPDLDRTVSPKGDHAAKRKKKSSTGPGVIYQYDLNGPGLRWEPQRCWDKIRKSKLFMPELFYLGSVDGDAFSPAREAVPAPDAQPLDTGAGTDEVASDGHVDSYFDVRVSNIAGDVIEMDLLPFAPGHFTHSLSYEENDGSEIHRLHDLSSAELSDRMSVLQEVERLAKRCAQQTQIIKKQTAELKQHKESAARASEEICLAVGTRSLGSYWSVEGQSAKEKAKIEEELMSRFLIESFVKRKA